MSQTTTATAATTTTTSTAKPGMLAKTKTTATPDEEDPFVQHILSDVRQFVVQTLAQTYKMDAEKTAALHKHCTSMTLNRLVDDGCIQFATFAVSQSLGKKCSIPEQEKLAADVTAALNQALVAAKLSSTPSVCEWIQNCIHDRHTVRIQLSPSVWSKLIPSILDGTFLAKRKGSRNSERVMIEYSQPNTHKAFHVGHMRNAALGDSLVRIYEAMGHPVVAANYFGDEGAHIAKCLWLLKPYLAEQKTTIEKVPIPAEQRAEWLGKFYADATELLELDTLTCLPYPNEVVAAQVETVMPHPDAASAKKGLFVVTLRMKPLPSTATQTVVCGGHGYGVGDIVAYQPVGTTFKGKPVQALDMKGVKSHGIILSGDELGIEGYGENEKEGEMGETGETGETGEKTGDETTTGMTTGVTCAATTMAVTTASKKASKKKSTEKKKSVDQQKSAAAVQKKTKSSDKKLLPKNKIFTFPLLQLKNGVKIDTKTVGNNAFLGQLLTEIGRYSNLKNVPANKQVVQEWKERNQQVDDTLKEMEAGNNDTAKLWTITKQWCMDEFKKIYKWLDCRFDHDFFESQCSEKSRETVLEQEKKGVLKKDNGAIIADLTPYKLGHLVLLKSNGAGLYATKDLELARIKFETFNIERSIYVVDAAQTLHFQQVFKVLELFGYKNAVKCFHLAYGQVVLPSGKMSSRKGNMIYFSSLTKMLGDQIQEDFLKRYENEWPASELAEARRQLSVAIIKYGMLNHDTAKDIVFEMSEWSAKNGKTGIYLMYAYARAQNILRTVLPAPEAKVDYSLLQSSFERTVLTEILQFWSVIRLCLLKNNPSGLCDYLYDLARSFSSWYENSSIKDTTNIHLKATRLAFVKAFGVVLAHGMKILGITVIDRM